MAFDRSKYQASRFETIKKEEAKFLQSDKKFVDYGEGRKAPFYTIAEGKNQVHVLPAHTPEDPAYVAMRTALLKVMSDEYENGEKTGRKVLRGKKIFIATQHCDAVREADPERRLFVPRLFQKCLASRAVAIPAVIVLTDADDVCAARICLDQFDDPFHIVFDDGIVARIFHARKSDVHAVFIGKADLV